ncbi:MAG: MarC family protein [Microscillaceae bacterium]|nr:MarC family protein [Microscillaceae bacterium]MDW8459849.1 MarC family protein [Cytophagales bacterium]
MREILSATLVLFSVIDILGAIPVIIDLKKKTGYIDARQTTLVSGILMFAFLFLGESILKLFGLDIASFAIAGAIIIFLIGFEMVLGIHLFKGDTQGGSSSIVPLAFPIIAGAGTMTTIITIRAEFTQISVIIAILLNLLLIFIVLRASDWLEKKLGHTGTEILRKAFGIILLAIAIKIFKTNLNF